MDEERIRNSPVEFYSCTFSVTDRKELDVDMKSVPEGQMQDMLLASSYLPVFKNENGRRCDQCASGEYAAGQRL